MGAGGGAGGSGTGSWTRCSSLRRVSDLRWQRPLSHTSEDVCPHTEVQPGVPVSVCANAAYQARPIEAECGDCEDGDICIRQGE